MDVPNLRISTRSSGWFYGALSLVFLRALPNLRYPLGPDQAAFCVVGQGLLHGQVLYRDVWDNKPPGIYYIYALIVKIFGPVMWSVGVVDILWLLVISCCIFWFARHYMGTAPAVLAMLFNACRHCRQGYFHAGQAETFLMVFVFAAYLLLLPANGRSAPQAPPPRPGVPTGWAGYLRYMAAGLAMGAAFWLKYSSVPFFPFLLVVPYVDFGEWDRGSSRLRMKISWRDWLVRTSIVIAGFLLAVLGVLAYIGFSGGWPAMKEGQFEVLPRYGATAFHWTFSYFAGALSRTESHLGSWSEVMAAVTLLIAWKQRELRFVAPALLLALAGYLSTAMQGRFLPYYFETCYPFFAMFWGYVCVKTYEGFLQLRRLFLQRQWTVAHTLLWVVFACFVFSLLPEESVRVVQQYKFFADWWKNPELSYQVYYYQLPYEKLSEQLSVVNYLKKNSTAEDEVYVWGFAPLINFLGQRRNPSRFVLNHVLISPWGPERWRQELVRTLNLKHPRYIVVERNDSNPGVSQTTMDSEQYLQVYPALAGLLRRQYEPAVNYWDFEIYRLK
jgi:hypothetical protein